MGREDWKERHCGCPVIPFPSMSLFSAQVVDDHKDHEDVHKEERICWVPWLRSVPFLRRHHLPSVLEASSGSDGKLGPPGLSVQCPWSLCHRQNILTLLSPLELTAKQSSAHAYARFSHHTSMTKQVQCGFEEGSPRALNQAHGPSESYFCPGLLLLP